jgi:hypothetical protein
MEHKVIKQENIMEPAIINQKPTLQPERVPHKKFKIIKFNSDSF